LFGKNTNFHGERERERENGIRKQSAEPKEEEKKKTKKSKRSFFFFFGVVVLSCPYCNGQCLLQLDYDGQRKRTKVKTKDLDPTWNEKVRALFLKFLLLSF
jgi:hypothetical protein